MTKKSKDKNIVEWLMIISGALATAFALIPIIEMILIKNGQSTTFNEKHVALFFILAGLSAIVFLIGLLGYDYEVKKEKRGAEIEEFNGKQKDAENTSCIINNVVPNSESGNPSITYGFKAPAGVSFRIFRSVGQAPTDFNDMERNGTCIVMMHANGNSISRKYTDDDAPMGTLYYTPSLKGAFSQIRAFGPPLGKGFFDGFKDPHPKKETESTEYVSQMGNPISYRFTGTKKAAKPKKTLSQKANDILFEVNERNHTRRELEQIIQRVEKDDSLSKADTREVIARLKSMAEPD